MKNLFALLIVMVFAHPAHAGDAPKSFKKAVAAAGTAEALKSSKTYACGKVVIQALVDNTTNVHVGESTVDKDTNNGIELDAGEQLVIDPGVISGKSACIDLNKVYVDADTNGEGVAVIYLER